MAHWDQEFFVLYSVTSTVSTICSFALIVTLFCTQLYRTSPHFFNIFFMTLCDLFLAMRHWIQYFDDHPTMEHNSHLCLLSAWTGTFFIMATSSWFFIISCSIFSVLVGYSTAAFHRYWMLHHIFVWGLSLFAATFPLTLGYYGPMPDDGTCWIQENHRLIRLVELIPLGGYLLFATFLLILSCFRVGVLVGLHSRHLILGRMFTFVIIFLLTWWWPFFHEFTILIGRHSPNEGYVRFLNLIAISGSGTWNFIVWTIGMCCSSQRSESSTTRHFLADAMVGHGAQRPTRTHDSSLVVNVTSSESSKPKRHGESAEREPLSSSMIYPRPEETTWESYQ